MSWWTTIVDNIAQVFSVDEPRVQVFSLGADNPMEFPIFLKRVTCSSNEQVAQVMQVAEFAQANPHPSICEIVQITKDSAPEHKTYVHIVVRRPGESLQAKISEIATRGLPGFPEDKLWKCFGNLLSAYVFLQQQGIAHRNVSSANICLDDRGYVYICDFGHATRITQEGDALYHLLDSSPYLSPALRLAIQQGEKNLDEVEHDVFKSDVYALGVLLSYMTFLELPSFFSSILDLRQSINTYFQNPKVQFYTQKWISALRKMLTYEEENRPTFSELHTEFANEFAALRNFSDDEAVSAAVPVAVPLAVPEQPDEVEISLKYGMNPIRISQTESDTVPCIVTLSTQKRSPNMRTRGIDLVCLVDVSGGMSGDPMTLLQSTLTALVSSLGKQDRMSIVTFSDDPERKCGLLVCTSKGKNKLQQIIAGLENFDLTNVLKGFQLALQVVQQRQMRHRASCILLLSDGMSNAGEDAFIQCPQALQKAAIADLKVNCFSFGDDVNIGLLEALATQGNGKRIHIANCRDISTALDQVLPQTSVVASQITIDLFLTEKVPVSCSIVEVFSDSRRDFSLPALSLNQKAHFIFLLKPDPKKIDRPARFSPVSASFVYTDSKGERTHRKGFENVLIVDWTEATPKKDESVFATLTRVRGTRRLHEAYALAEQGQFEKAREILEAASQELHTEPHEAQLGVLGDIQSAVLMMSDQQQWAKQREAYSALKFYSYNVIEPAV